MTPLTLTLALLNPALNGADLALLPVAVLGLAYYFRVIPTLEIRRTP